MNPIKGSELYQDDGAIRKLIAELAEAKKAYEDMAKVVRGEAAKLKKSINETSSANDASTKAQEANAKQAEALARQYEKYRASITDVGREQIKLRQLQTQRNQLVKAEIRLNNSAEGSYDRLSAQYSLNKIKLNAMSSEQRSATAEGRKLEKQTKDIYEEMKRLQEATGKTALSVGDYKNSIKDAFSDIGASALGPAAVGAAVAAGVVEAAQYVGEISQEIRKIRGEISILTDATGEELDGLTSRIRGVASTFGEEDSGILQAANAVSKQLGISFDEALSKIEEGFVAGSNINGEFLDSLREYPTFFKEAGLSADQLFQVLNQSATEGIYSDKGVDAIKEATVRLREQPQAVQDALAAIGLSSEETRKIIEERGIGAAIATVSERLGELKSTSPEVGRAIAGIFGGAGEDAGLSFLLTLKDLESATSSVIDQNNEYQLQQLKLLEVNQELADAQGDLVTALGGTGASMETLKAQGESFLFRAALPLIEAVKVLWQSTEPLREGLQGVFEALGLAGKGGTVFEGVLNLIVIAARVVAVPVRVFANILGFLYDRIADVINVGRSFLEFLGVVGNEQEKAGTAAQNMGRGNRAAYDELNKLNEKTKETAASTKTATKSMTDFGKATSDTKDKVKEFTDGSLSKLSDTVKKLKQELDEAAPGDQIGLIRQLREAEIELKELEAYFDGVRDRLNSDPLTITPQIEVADFSNAATEEKLQKAIAGIKIKPSEVSPDGEKDIFELLGFDISDDKKEAIGSAFDFAKQQVLELANIRTQLAGQRVQEATDDVRSAEAALQAEISRNENGLASNIEAREADLRSAEEVQRKAREEQQKAQRAERRLQSIQQAANLVTASAKIFSQLGFPAALPAIGIMFGTFAATKIKAARLARQENRRGTFQFLRGGSSHETGNDISLGIDGRGVEQIAERGESFAVIPSQATNQYREVLPSLFNALSAGKLNQWVDRQGNSSGKVSASPQTIKVNGSSAKMEQGISEIAKNTAKRIYQDGAGNTVIEEGYNKTIIRRA